MTKFVKMEVNGKEHDVFVVREIEGGQVVIKRSLLSAFDGAVLDKINRNKGNSFDVKAKDEEMPNGQHALVHFAKFETTVMDSVGDEVVVKDAVKSEPAVKEEYVDDQRIVVDDNPPQDDTDK